MLGKFDTDNFHPTVWSTILEDPQLAGDVAGMSKHQGLSGPLEWLEVLTCQKRVLNTQKLKEVHPLPNVRPDYNVALDDSITVEKILLPVAIGLMHPIHVFYGMPGSFFGEHRNWVITDAKERKISKRCAQAALGAAWKGYGEGGISWPNITKASFKFSAPYRTLGINMDRPQDLTMLRDVTLWIHWDQWEREKLSLEQRTDILNSWGYLCTLKAVKRVVEKVLG